MKTYVECQRQSFMAKLQIWVTNIQMKCHHVIMAKRNQASTKPGRVCVNQKPMKNTFENCVFIGF